jgi:hypothetical protein
MKTVALLKHKRKILFTLPVEDKEDPFDVVFREISKKLNATLSGASTSSLEDKRVNHAREREEERKRSAKTPYGGSRRYESDTDFIKREVSVGRYRQNFRIKSSSFQWIDRNVMASKEMSEDNEKDTEPRWVVLAGLPVEQGRTKVGGAFAIRLKEKKRGAGKIFEFTIKEHCVCSSLEVNSYGETFVFDGKKSPPQHIHIKVCIGEKYQNPVNFEWDLSIDAEEARHGDIFELFDTAMLLSRRMRQIIYASTTVGRTAKMALHQLNSKPIRVRV